MAGLSAVSVPRMALLGAFAAAFLAMPGAARLLGPRLHESLKLESRNLSHSKASASTNQTSALEPLEPYRYTVHTPTPNVPQRSLILLGPWNGSAGFFTEWFLDDFEKMEPKAIDKYRILDVVGRKMPSGSEWDPYPYNSWYEYEDWHSETVVAHDVDLAVAYVHGLIEEEYAIVGDYRRIVLAGFSQGANVAIEAALRFPHRLGLVLSQRGILLASRKEDWTPVASTPYILTAGADDEVYLEDMVKENCRWLQDMHAPAYMKTLTKVGHYRRSKRECDLTIKSFVALVSEAKEEKEKADPLTEHLKGKEKEKAEVDKLEHLTDWTDCHS